MRKRFFIPLFALLFTLCMVNLAYAATIFSDGFESGNLNAWNGVYLASGCSLNVETGNPHHGTYNLKAVTAGAAATEYAYAYKYIGASYSRANIRAYVKYTAYSGGANTAAPSIAFWVGATTSGVSRAGLGKDASNVYRWTIRYYHAGTFYSAYGSSVPQLNQWYCLELETQIGAGTGYVKLYVDGQLEIQVGNINNADRQFAYIHAGVDNTVGTVAATVVLDCVVTADTYIGPEPAKEWRTVASWTLQLKPCLWTLIGTWTSQLQTRQWTLIDTWTQTWTGAGWRTVTSWTSTIIARAWKTIAEWFTSLGKIWAAISEWKVLISYPWFYDPKMVFAVGLTIVTGILVILRFSRR